MISTPEESYREIRTTHFSSTEVGSHRVFSPLPRRAGFPNTGITNVFDKERLMGIEPTFQAWEAGVLPLHHSRAKRVKTLFRQAYIDSTGVAIPCNQLHSCAVMLNTKVVESGSASAEFTR